MSSRPVPPPPAGPLPRPERSLAVCALLGAAAMAAVDEIVFHQLLHWHHFYDRSTSGVGLLSDGLLHTAELLGLVAGFFLFADLRRRRALAPAHAWAGLFLGLGGFQLFDGIVDHKLLRVHQIRYGVDVTGYDWAWNGAGAALFLLGAALAVRARGRAPGGRAGGRRCDLRPHAWRRTRHGPLRGRARPRRRALRRRLPRGRGAVAPTR